MKYYFYMFVFMLAFLTILAERNGFYSITGLFIWAWGVHPYFKVTISLLLVTLGILAIMLGYKVIKVLIKTLKEEKPSGDIYKKVK